MRHQRSYQAATIDRLTQAWSAGPTPIDSTLRTALPVLRERSRDQIKNNDYGRRFISLLKSNVIGATGIQVQARVTRLDSTKLDDPANEVIEAAWRDWGRRSADWFGDLSWLEIQKLMISTAAGDGEFIAIEHTGKDAGPYGYQLELIDPERLDVGLNGPTKNGGQVRLGIEYDANGRRVAYHFRAVDPLTGYHAAGETRTVPASMVIHCYIKEWIDQSRGIPWMAPALRRLKMLGGYEEAAITAARIGASKMGFFTSEEETPPIYADEIAADGNLIQDVEPGVLEQLPSGVNFQSFDPDYPHQQFADFIKASLRGISSGLDVSYNTLASDLEGVNYSSIRAGVLEDREIYKAVQEWVVDKFVRRVYENWVAAATMKGALKMGKTPLARPAAAYKAATFQPRRWSWVDPQKDMAAHESAVALGIRSRSEIIRDMGRDPEEVWREIQAEKALMQKYGIETASGGTDGQKTAFTDDA